MYLRSGPLAAGVRAAMETSLANSGFEAIRLSTNGGLAVEARIAGQPARLLLDTGSGVTVLDREAAERFGLRLEAVEGYAHRLRRVPGELAIARVELLEVGTLRFSERTAAVADLGPWVEDAADDTWSGVDGALGVEFLGGHPALIDCRDQRLYLKKLAQ
jgi:predicted aspartyl protease